MINRTHLERLLDLSDMIEVYKAGEKVNKKLYGERIRPGCSDPFTYMKRAFEIAHLLDHKIGMVRDADDLTGEWIVDIEDPAGLYKVVRFWLKRLLPKRRSKASTVKKIKKQRQKLADRGICIECKKAEAQDGRLKCRQCRLLDSQRALDRRGLLRSVNVCEKCGKDMPAEGRTMCQECITSRAADQARYRAERIAAGLCSRCGNAPAMNGPLCENCHAHEIRRGRSPERRESVNEERKRRREAGLCVQCGEPAALRGDKRASLCEEHLAYAARKRVEYLARKKGLL